MASQSSPVKSGASSYLSFTRKLAHTEKKERDRAVRFVAKWLAHQPDASEADLRKLWQGLFFCLWHADKLLVQAEVATNLASLTHSGGTVEAGMRYLSAALWTVQQRWQTVDKYRVDKFLSLLRHLLRQALLLLARHQWRAEDIALFGHAMANYPYGNLTSETDSTLALPLCPGIALHFADIFLDELKLALATSEEGGGEVKLRKGLVNDLLEPFLRAASQYPHKLVLDRVENRVLQPLLHLPSARAPATAPVRFVDHAALTERLFELATSKETKDTHRGRIFRLKNGLQKTLNTPAVAAPVNGVSTSQENGMEAEEESESVNEAEEEAEEAEGEEEEEDAEAEIEDETPATKKRKHAPRPAMGLPQPSWVQAFRLKKPRMSRGVLLGVPAEDGDDCCSPDGTCNGGEVTPNGSPSRQRTKSNKVRFSLERNMSQEFLKVDPPAKHSRGSSPIPNRKPAFGILKASPLKAPISPAVQK
jgi:ribosomal RNA-processing protein 1